jgi:predicted DNA-binding antitoxin AbrB/MazE fold protein
MGAKTLEAVFENGVFRPLQPQELALTEGQKVQLVVEAGEALPEDNPIGLQMPVEPTEIEKGGVLTALQGYAVRGDSQRLRRLIETTDWMLGSPDELATAIEVALDLEMSKDAIELARLGSQIFPEHPRIQKLAHVLVPTPACIIDGPEARGLDASSAWLREHGLEYQGLWVAVREGELLGAAPRLKELAPLIGEGQDAISTLVVRIT